MDESSKTSENKPKRATNGQLLPGNTANLNGRPRNAEIDEFRQALKRVERQEDRKPIFDHFIEQAYEDKTVLVALMRKLLPDLKMVEADIKTEGFRIIIERPQDSTTKPQGKPGDVIYD